MSQRRARVGPDRDERRRPQTDAVDWTRICDLFAEAVSRPPGERAAFLDERCSGEAAVRCTVARMLDADGRHTAFDDMGAFW